MLECELSKVNKAQKYLDTNELVKEEVDVLELISNLGPQQTLSMN